MIASAKRLIVNADDFGFTRDVNDGIVDAHRRGILTATTLMANGAAFEDAVRLARETPSLDVGCHLVLVQGPSVLDPARQLPATVPDLLKAVLRGDLPLFREAAAQIRRLQRAGIQPTHLDTHKHTHLLPPVLEAVARAAREFGIPWVRVPLDFDVEPGLPATRSALGVGLRALRPYFRHVLRGLRVTDSFSGFQMTGSLDETRLAATLHRLPDGLTELMCHPGRLGEELNSAPTRLKESRPIELEALTASAVRDEIANQGIQLVNYRV